MVTAARSRHIRFTFIIQNFAQLDKTYGKEDAQTIRGNCVNTIYLLTGELSALEEISKLCGDKLVRVGKDKKEETRPLVTISELQRMKPDEYILVRHRCPPYKGKLMMDFKSDFGFGVGADLYGKDVVYPERAMSDVKVFDIKEFVKKKKQDQMGAFPSGPSPFGGMPQGMPPFPGIRPMENKQKQDFDLDQMIKDIDKKIAELEKEEEEEKRKIASKTKSIGNSTNNEDIIKPRILDDEELERMIKKAESNKVENEPKEKEVVDSRNIDFDNFSIKNEEVFMKEAPIKNDIKEPKKEENEDYDFFDDFFFEE